MQGYTRVLPGVYRLYYQYLVINDTTVLQTCSVRDLPVLKVVHHAVKPQA